MTHDAAIARSLDDLAAEPSSITIGFFDGVHRGHQSIIRRAIDRARADDLRAVAVTFDRHPAETVRPDSVPPLLMTAERRLRTLAGSGVDLVVALPFTDEMAQTPAERFVELVLVETLAARHVVVGQNFRFGHKAAGDPDLLVEMGRDHGFEAEPVRLLSDADVDVSSSAIREHLADGDVEWAARALGRPHVLDGTVARGEGRGKALGVPTANLDLDPRVLVPADGVYAGMAELPDGREQPAVTSIGRNPTFGDGNPVTVEAHLLDADEDLYDADLGVQLAHRLRGQERYDTTDGLIAAMRRDIRRARDLLGV